MGRNMHERKKYKQKGITEERCMERRYASPGATLLLSLSLHRFLPPLFTSPMDMFTSVHAQELISPDEAAEVIVAALADPASVPLACINILIYSYGVLSRLWIEPEDDDHQKVFRRYRDVPRCTMRFLCSFRSAEQFRVLKQTLERGPCRCARGPEALHKLISPSRHRTLLVPGVGRLHHLIECMDLMLVSTISKQRGLLKLYKATRRSLWPTSMSDFVPDGSASLHNLIRWLPHMDTSEQIDHGILICHVFEAMPSHLRAGFIKGPMLVDWLHHTMTTWIMQPINVHADLPLAMTSTGPLLESARNLSEEELFLWLSSSPRHTIQDMFTALDRTLIVMVNYPSHAASYEQVDALREPYKLIINYMILAHQPDVYFIPSMYTSASDQESLRVRRTDPVMRLGRTAFGSNWSQRCYGPGCIATYADRSKTFKRCSGCRTATYCSRKCQTAAWRHPTAAHREVCGLYQACKDAMLPHEDDINEAAVRAWGALPRQQLDAASANIEQLRATQLVCLSACLLLSNLLRCDLILLAEEEMDSIPTDEL
jgi:hypothetical protein